MLTALLLPLVVGIGIVVVLTAGVVYLRRQLLVVTVAGHSMEPTLHEGDRLLVWRLRSGHLRQGDLVVIDPPAVRVSVGGILREPIDGTQVKRVAALPGQSMPAGVRSSSRVVPVETVVVVSDNARCGVDSRQWGPYPAHGVVGVVVRRMKAGAYSSVTRRR